MLSVPRPGALERSWWTLGVMAVWLPLLAALGWSIWTTPYPVNETVALLEDVKRGGLSALDPTVRAWYRPLYFLTWDVLWRATGSLDGALALFKLIEVVSPLALVLLLVRHMRPRTGLDAAAAMCAVAVLMGTSGFRDNLEVPLLMTLVAMPLAMATWMLLSQEPRAWHGPLIVLFVLVAIGFKEQGLVLAPVVVIAWWTRAPGAGTRLTATVVMLVLAYLAFRFAWSGNWPIFEQSMGLGLQSLEPSEALARFGAFPYGMYVYNALSTMLNVLIGEPTAGRFVMVLDALYQRVGSWHVVQVASAVGLSATILWWSSRVIPGLGRDGWTPESRAALVFLVSLLACGALSVKYSRDRLSGMAAAFYALAAYEAIRYVAARAIEGAGAAERRMALTGGLLVVLALTWHVRAVGTLEWTRRQSESNAVGWLTQLAPRGLEFADRPVYLDIMRHMTPQGTTPNLSRQTNYPPFLLRTLLGAPPD